MSTADKLESDNLLMGFRDRVKAIKEHCEKEDQRTEDLQKEIQDAHSHYMESLKKKDSLREQIEQTRNKLLNVSKEDLETRIKTQKDIYLQTEQMVRIAEEKRDKLEMQLDETEDKTKDCAFKMNTLNMELEYKSIDNERRTKEYNFSSEAASTKEKSCAELDEQLQSFESRIAVAQEKIEELEQKIDTCEQEIETTIQDKAEMHMKFRELILAANTDLAYFSG